MLQWVGFGVLDEPFRGVKTICLFIDIYKFLFV